MPTILDIDDRLLHRALRMAGRKTKRETVNFALEEVIRQKQRDARVESFGTVEFRPDWDHKKARRRR